MPSRARQSWWSGPGAAIASGAWPVIGSPAGGTPGMSGRPRAPKPAVMPSAGPVLRDSFVGDGSGVAVGDGRRRWGGLGVGVVVIAPGHGGAHGRDGGRGHRVRGWGVVSRR